MYDGVNVRMEFTKADGVAGGAPAALSVRYFNGQGVDDVLAQENYSPQAVPGQIGSTYWLIKDQVGSTTDVLNANGQQVNHIDYTTFGQFQILDQNTGTYTVSANPPAGTVTTHLFTGREFDAEAGNYYYRARNYNADIGRFLSEDPLGETDRSGRLAAIWAGARNLYSYAGNEPLQENDPLGLCELDKKLKKPTWEDWATGFPIKYFYGNWGGENYSGGYSVSNMENLPPEVQDELKNIPARDPVDQAFKNHDFAMTDAARQYKESIANNNSSDMETRINNFLDIETQLHQKIMQAHGALIADLTNALASPNGSKLSPYQVMSAAAAIAAFTIENSNEAARLESARSMSYQPGARPLP
jgi:RHS repeat-associated protein